MSWLSDKIADVDALYQRVLIWERFAFLREREWRIPVQGTTDEFAECFRRLVFQVSRDEFFRLNGWHEDHNEFGFCINDEVALKVPPRPKISYFVRTLSLHRPVYHFHGSLIHDGTELCLYGHHRADRYMNKFYLRLANWYFFFCSLWFLSSVGLLVLNLFFDTDIGGTLGSMVVSLILTGVWAIYVIVVAQTIEKYAVHTQTRRRKIRRTHP